MQATLTTLFETESISLDQLHIFSLLEVDDATVRHDMELFVQAQWDLHSRKLDPAVLESPKRLLARLIDQCGHTFELAAVLIRWGIAELTTPDDGINERRLNDMIVAWETTHYNSAITGSLYHALDRLYYIILHRVITSGGHEDTTRGDLDDRTGGSEPEDTTKKQLKSVIALLALRTQPLSTEMIAEITAVPFDKLVVLLRGMSSVLRLPDAGLSDFPVEAILQVIEPYNSSFLDFVIDGVRSGQEDFHIRLDDYTGKCAAMVLNVICRPQTQHISRAIEYSASSWQQYLLTGLSGIDYDGTLSQLQLLQNYTHWRSEAVKSFSKIRPDHLKILASTCSGLLKRANRDLFQMVLEALREASETRHGRGRRIIGVAYAATIIALAFPKRGIANESFTNFIRCVHTV
ncbi:hypothetical protein BKA62DRAFT_56274 [Auriculariales sp. MPI-PUGE-AT-0066]|nr:hypothetical protein BKA62DRAFT_56274 [Auriculariales sp. MPI-PUGE-AT-0066]